MVENSPAEEVYNETGCVKYKALTDFFFYPFGISDFVSKKITINKGDRILDAGCGFGVLSKAVDNKIRKEEIPNTERHAFDISADMLAAFEKIGLDNIELRRLDVRELSYDDDYFDLVVTSAMLEYVPDINQGLTSLKRCLKPGGRIFLFMSRKSWLNNFLFRPFGDPKCYSSKEVEDIFRAVGFKSIRRHRFPLSSFWLNLWGFVVEASK